jgi:tetratricopeptide (TPR) repeat protein
MGDYGNAMKDFGEALNRSKELGYREIIALNLLNKGMLQSYLGDFSHSLHNLVESLSLWQEMGDKAGEAHTLSTLAEVYSALGDHQEATEYLQAADELIQEIGDKVVEIEYLNSKAFVDYERGDYPGALESYLRVEMLARVSNSRYFLVQSKLGLSRTYLAQGRQREWEHARQYAEEAVALCQELQLAGDEPRGHAYLGKGNLLLGDRESALQSCQEVIRLLDKQKRVHSSEAEIYLIAIEILAATGWEEERRWYLEQAYGLVQATANKVKDEALRQSYMAMPTNRKILEVWERERAGRNG